MYVHTHDHPNPDQACNRVVYSFKLGGVSRSSVSTTDPQYQLPQ